MIINLRNQKKKKEGINEEEIGLSESHPKKKRKKKCWRSSRSSRRNTWRNWNSSGKKRKKKRKRKKIKKRKREEVEETNVEENGNGEENGNVEENGNGAENGNGEDGDINEVEQNENEEIIGEDNQVEEYDVPQKKKRKVNEPWRRIDTSKSLGLPILSDYKKIQGDEGAKRVNVNLKNVTGDRFRHEKTKKKRSFKSGAKITLGVHSKTLDSSDDD